MSLIEHFLKNSFKDYDGDLLIFFKDYERLMRGFSTEFFKVYKGLKLVFSNDYCQGF